MPRNLLATIALLAVTGCGSDDQTEQIDTAKQTVQAEQLVELPEAQTDGFASPKEAFEAYQAARAANDDLAALRCLSPKSQDDMAALITMSMGLMAAVEPAKKKEIVALLAKHGIHLSKELDVVARFPIEDRSDKLAYIAEVTQWMRDHTTTAVGGHIAEGTLGAISIEEDSGRAAVTLNSGKAKDVEFLRLDGRWFLHRSIKLAAPTTAEAVELKSPSGEGGFGIVSIGEDGWPQDDSGSSFAAEREGIVPLDSEVLRPLEAVTLDQVKSAWLTTLKIENQPAGELLERLVGELGLEFIADKEQTASLQKKVSLAMKVRSRFEAIDEICRQIEMTPVYSEKKMRLQLGTRTSRVVFSGPFLIEAGIRETRAETASGTLTVYVFSAGLPRAVVKQPFSHTVIKVANSDEDSLQRQNRETSRSRKWPTVFASRKQVPLKNLLSSVKAISVLKGKVSLQVPTGVARFTFDEFETGIEKKSGKASVRLTKVDGREFTFQSKGLQLRGKQIVGYDKNGKRVEELAGFGSNNSFHKIFRTPPARIEFRVITSWVSIAYEYEMNDIVIPNSAKMRERLAELKIEGDSPVTVKFVKLTGDKGFRKILFGVTNHTNKLVEEIDLEVKYLDASGKVLKETRSSLRDEVPAGDELECEDTAFFMPMETTAVEATVSKITFADASVWQMPK